MSKVELSDFQKRFLLGQGAGQTLYTDKEFNEALAQAKAEIMAVAIQTTKQAIMIERDACAEIVREWEGEPDLVQMSDAILNRIPSQRQ